MKTKYKHIHFEDISSTYPKRITLTYYCRNNTGLLLGTICWDCGWRQYTFVTDNTFALKFSAGCCDDISHFIKQLMKQRDDKKLAELLSKMDESRREL